MSKLYKENNNSTSLLQNKSMSKPTETMINYQKTNRKMVIIKCNKNNQINNSIFKNLIKY